MHSSPIPHKTKHTKQTKTAGLILSLLDVLRLRKFALYLEDLFGGRVGYLSPANQRESDPFIMLVHHRHTVCQMVDMSICCCFSH